MRGEAMAKPCTRAGALSQYLVATLNLARTTSLEHGVAKSNIMRCLYALSATICAGLGYVHSSSPGSLWRQFRHNGYFRYFGYFEYFGHNGQHGDRDSDPRANSDVTANGYHGADRDHHGYGRRDGAELWAGSR